MAKNGFVPAWMKISNSDKTNGKQNLNIDQAKNNNHRQLQNETIITGRQRHHSSDIDDHTTTRQTLFYYSKSSGRCRNKSNEQQSSNDFDEQSENVFAFPSRRSYSRERLSNSFGKDTELNGHDYFSSSNNRSSINSNTNHQRRLHSLSSYNNGHNHQNLINGNNLERLSNDNHSDMTIKPNEKDFPSLNGRELSSKNNEQSSIWNNAASKFRLSNNEISSFKYFDRSLSTNHGNLSRTFGSNRLIPRKDRLLSSPNNSNINSRPITQPNNLDKRSDFLNYLKNETRSNSNESFKIPKGTLLLLSVPETPEEKELLIRMGWNDDMTYEITDKDKEEYEKRTKILPKTDNRSAVSMSTLNRRALPCINIRDIFQFEMIDSSSDDDSSED